MCEYVRMTVCICVDACIYAYMYAPEHLYSTLLVIHKDITLEAVVFDIRSPTSETWLAAYDRRRKNVRPQLLEHWQHKQNSLCVCIQRSPVPSSPRWWALKWLSQKPFHSIWFCQSHEPWSGFGLVNWSPQMTRGSRQPLGMMERDTPWRYRTSRLMIVESSRPKWRTTNMDCLFLQLYCASKVSVHVHVHPWLMWRITYF